MRNMVQRIKAWRRSKEVRVAVAGLPKSGKTVLITSILTNITAASRSSAGLDWLKGLAVVDQGRLHSAEVPRNFNARHGRMFPLDEMQTALSADAPRWPRRTANVYEAAIDLNFWPDQKPDRPDAPYARLRLIVVDYPGEWLVDIPMIAQSFADWSKSVLQRLESAPWSEVAQPFRGMLADTSWTGGNDNAAARRAAEAWQRALVAAKAQGLKWIQPAQFVRRRDAPDDAGIPTLHDQGLWFCPLPEDAIRSAKTGSLAAEMQKRYDEYQRRTVAVFFNDVLRGASRHVLLVDVIEALAEGEHGFTETAEVLSEVYRILRDNPPLIRRILGRSGFEKVLLVATKADSVPPVHRPALKDLLVDMCAGRIKGAAGIAAPDAMHVAAIRATEDIEIDADGGGPVKVVVGRGEDGKRRQVTLFEIPDKMPEPGHFRRRVGVRPPRFIPPAIHGRCAYGIPNLRLGGLLQKLIGDVLE